MVTIEGEDYMILAQAKGLKPFYVLYRYMIRNAISATDDGTGGVYRHPGRRFGAG